MIFSYDISVNNRLNLMVLAQLKNANFLLVASGIDIFVYNLTDPFRIPKNPILKIQIPLSLLKEYDRIFYATRKHNWISQLLLKKVSENTTLLIAVADNAFVFGWDINHLNSPPFVIKSDETAWGCDLNPSAGILGFSTNARTITLYNIFAILYKYYKLLNIKNSDFLEYSHISNNINCRLLQDNVSGLKLVFVSSYFISILGHNHNIPCIAFSENGKYVVSSSVDYTCRIFECFTGNCILSMKVGLQWGWNVKFLDPANFESTQLGISQVVPLSLKSDVSSPTFGFQSAENMYSGNVPYQPIFPSNLLSSNFKGTLPLNNTIENSPHQSDSNKLPNQSLFPNHPFFYHESQKHIYFPKLQYSYIFDSSGIQLGNLPLFGNARFTDSIFSDVRVIPSASYRPTENNIENRRISNEESDLVFVSRLQRLGGSSGSDLSNFVSLSDISSIGGANINQDISDQNTSVSGMSSDIMSQDSLGLDGPDIINEDLSQELLGHNDSDEYDIESFVSRRALYRDELASVDLESPDIDMSSDYSNNILDNLVNTTRLGDSDTSDSIDFENLDNLDVQGIQVSGMGDFDMIDTQQTYPAITPDIGSVSLSPVPDDMLNNNEDLLNGNPRFRPNFSSMQSYGRITVTTDTSSSNEVYSLSSHSQSSVQRTILSTGPMNIVGSNQIESSQRSASGETRNRRAGGIELPNSNTLPLPLARETRRNPTNQQSLIELLVSTRQRYDALNQELLNNRRYLELRGRQLQRIRRGLENTALSDDLGEDRIFYSQLSYSGTKKMDQALILYCTESKIIPEIGAALIATQAGLVSLVQFRM
ncbi:hypothetical protein BB560_000590 [Smittium megazygosporum]|uniref:Uncharacterized protein n=1 Tax=Smittium megazygosporum TaxID=133381 RepID=A0A2T9ZJY3_9FUNG|nr:hypothetical protein BB560_000590 [Smittium megazygosporum]